MVRVAHHFTAQPGGGAENLAGIVTGHAPGKEAHHRQHKEENRCPQDYRTQLLTVPPEHSHNKRRIRDERHRVNVNLSILRSQARSHFRWKAYQRIRPVKYPTPMFHREMPAVRNMT